MQHPDRAHVSALVPLIIVLGVTALWGVSTRAGDRPQEQAPAVTECRADLHPAVVAAGMEARIEVVFAESPGEVTAVRTEQGSGIVVRGFETVAGDEHLTARLEIPLESAGAWWLEFDAAGTTCRALLTVTESALDR